MQNFNRSTSGFVKRPSLWSKFLSLLLGGKMLDIIFAGITTCVIAAVLMVLWPQVAYTFPRAVGEGWLEPNLSFFQAVCIVVLLQVLGLRVKR